jgi:SAM-dependent methyltransferase
MFVCFAFVLLFGAPFLPTLRPEVKEALDLLDLKPGQTLLELGSGDGRVLQAAAERGIKAVGIELNPLLWLWSVWQTRKQRNLISVKLGNFWRLKLPPADGVFVFLLQPYMKRFDSLIHSYNRPVRVVSFAFEIPGRQPVAQVRGLRRYDYAPEAGRARRNALP